MLKNQELQPKQLQRHQNLQQKKKLQNQSKRNQQNKITGNKGEQLAADYLQTNGYEILSRNEYMHWGELDIVARKENTIIFIEVKTRIGFMKGNPYEAVRFAKVNYLLRSARFFIQKNNLQDFQHRIDVISIVLSTTGTIITLKHFENITQ